ncbi:MAG: beta-ketoacyl synthase N-terminal-like domain-containing protein, partial [Gammaproteobacteria bacterium]
NSDAVSFHYTDISSTFLRHGQRSFGAQYPCLVFERLNIEHDPVEQGFEAGGFDLVFASNVLHDTRYLDNTLAQVGKLLRPDGLLILNEFTVMKDLLLYTGGLLHGWWLFQDPEHRLSNSCLLGVSHWKAILEKSGWGDFTAFGLPFEQDLAQCRQSVMFCTRAAGAQAQAMPLAQSVAQAAAGPASAPASEPLLDLVMDSIGEIIGAKRLAAFEPATPLMEQGVDSLELVELNALLGKKTGLRLETSFLFQFNTAEKLSRHFRARLGAAAPEPAPAPAPAEDPALRAGVEAIIAKLIGARRMNGFTPELPLMELGIDSLELLELRTLLGQQFGVELNASFLFQYNTCAKIAAYLDKRPALQPSPAAPPVEVDAADVAIVGMALRFPGKASDPDSFWQLLTTGTSAIGALAPERLDWPAQVDVAGDKAYLTRGGFLDRIDEFDAPFFRISPMEAELMDPQQRMLLELVWGALEDAGHKPSALAGPATGVYVGACHFEYRSLLERSGTSQGAFVATGSSASILANRISYFYDFQGPSVLVDTACSSSLVAVHQAVRDLRDGACRQALVGGVNLICNTVNVLAYDHAGMLSADSRCATFDAGANGYVRGEGGAVIVLKRLRDALDDGDRIYATIKGSAISHGGQASSLTAPNPEAQGALIVRAARDARVDGASIGYVEAHGTGTRLGDPIEVEGLKQAFAQFAAEGEAPACALASVKSNIGHLEGAAGIAGLIKAALCLRHRTLVPTLHFSRLNPEINLGPALHVASTLTAWPARTDGAGRALPRRAGVSAFGFGGAMAHVILEEHAQAPRSGEPGGPYLFVLSAKNDAQLLATAGRVATFLERAGNQPGFSLAGLCYTLQVGREEMDERLAIVFDSRDELAGLLAAFTQGRAAGPTVYRGRRQAGRAQPAALQGRALHALAAAWVGGGAVDWRALYPGAAPQRIAVPGYAFARQRYWVARAPQAGQSAAVAAPARFNSVFSGHEAFLTDHRVNDRKVLPGVMYLELARAAAGAVAGQTGNALRISQVVWASPVFVDGAAVTVQTTVKRGGEERWSFEMRSGAGQADGLAAHLHAQGELALSHAEAPRIDLDARLRACGAGVLDAQRFYQGFAAIGIDYGPAHRGVTELRFGSDEVLARLAIGPESARDSGALFLHPGLLDSALQATYAFAIRAGQPTLMLPFVLDQVDVFGPC